ncbi:MAG: hypothetical protein ABIZ57_10775 [Candidatus Limnocylindria bacterium]
MSDAVRPAERELSDEDRGRLEAAHRALRDAVAAYESFVGGALTSGDTAVVHNADEMRRAQEAVGGAEDRLWQLREDLLGWTRPSWVPSAALTSDWFSEEDAVYDDVPETTAS